MKTDIKLLIWFVQFCHVGHGEEAQLLMRISQFVPLYPGGQTHRYIATRGCVHTP